MLFEDVVLGNKYRDSVTGFVGTATGKAEYLSTSGSVLLESLVETKPVREWFDINRINPAE